MTDRAEAESMMRFYHRQGGKQFLYWKRCLRRALIAQEETEK